MKIKVGVIFGGESVEHEVSIISAIQAMNKIDLEKYEVVPIYITKDREWYTGEILRDIETYQDLSLIKKGDILLFHRQSKNDTIPKVDNKYPGISELCQNNSLSGYDLFFINDDTLKNELGLSSFHERKVTLKLINKLIYEHLKLNVINSNGDNVILTLDNNQDTSSGELSEYIGGMFNINPKDILYKDNSKTEVLSPTLKIVKLLILYPRLYKTLNVFNMKDYHQSGDNENNENLESKNNEYPNNLNNNNSVV